MNFWAPLLIAGATIVASGYIATAEAHRNGCRVNGYNGHNGCRVSGFRAYNGCRVSGFRGFNGDAGGDWQRVRVYGWHTRMVPVSNGFDGYDGFNGSYGFRGCDGYSGFRTFNGYNGYNGFNGVGLY
jgi:hypothetical protein